MAVGEKDRGDLKIEEPARYMVNGTWYDVGEVYPVAERAPSSRNGRGVR